jgi:hypothetical protein
MCDEVAERSEAPSAEPDSHNLHGTLRGGNAHRDPEAPEFQVRVVDAKASIRSDCCDGVMPLDRHDASAIVLLFAGATRVRH